MFNISSENQHLEKGRHGRNWIHSDKHVEQTLDLQHDALLAEGAAGIYQDKASGKTADRPELRHCIKALRDGDTVVVWRLDRLGRILGGLHSWLR